MNRVAQVHPGEAEKDICISFDVDTFVPGCQIVVNVSASILSLLSKEQVPDRCVLLQRILTDTEIRILLPLLSSPFCCPQDVLHASYHCTSDVLLQSLLSPNAQWNELVGVHRRILDAAHQQKAQREEMRGVYNALSSLRQKLRQLGITICSKREGYYLSAI